MRSRPGCCSWLLRAVSFGLMGCMYASAGFPAGGVPDGRFLYRPRFLAPAVDLRPAARFADFVLAAARPFDAFAVARRFAGRAGALAAARFGLAVLRAALAAVCTVFLA